MRHYRQREIQPKHWEQIIQQAVYHSKLSTQVFGGSVAYLNAQKKRKTVLLMHLAKKNEQRIKKNIELAGATC